MEEKQTKKLPAENIPLVMKNIEFAQNLARQFHRQRPNIGIDADDFEGAAFYGLCDAACRFDPKRGMNFQTFAYLRIRGAMYDLLRRGGGMSWVYSCRPLSFPGVTAERHVGVQVTTQTGHAELNDSNSVYTKNLYQFIRFTEILSHIGIKPHANAAQEVEDVSYLVEHSPEAITINHQLKHSLRKIVALLPLNERRVIELRYYHECSLEDVQKHFGGASKTWLSRLHGRALKNLRNILQKQNAQWGRIAEEKQAA